MVISYLDDVTYEGLVPAGRFRLKVKHDYVKITTTRVTTAHMIFSTDPQAVDPEGLGILYSVILHNRVTVAAGGNNTSSVIADLRRVRDAKWSVYNEGLSANVDIEVQTSDSPTGVFDTIAYDSMNIGASVKRTKPLGGDAMGLFARIRVTEAGGANSAIITTKFIGVISTR